MDIELNKKYADERRWYLKVVIMEVYHLSMKQKDKDWTIAKTAKYFNTSIGLASENLQLAKHMHKDAVLVNCENREKALAHLRNIKPFTPSLHPIEDE